MISPKLSNFDAIYSASRWATLQRCGAVAAMFLVATTSLFMMLDAQSRWDPGLLRWGLSLLWWLSVALALGIVLWFQWSFPDRTTYATVWERRTYHTGDWLSSAVDFANSPPFQGESQELRSHSIAQAAIRFDTHVNARLLTYPASTRVIKHAFTLSLVALVVSGYLYTDAWRIGLSRLSNPWSGATWPARHTLQLLDLPPHLAFGSTATIRVRNVQGPLPSTMYLMLRQKGTEAIDTIELGGGADNECASTIGPFTHDMELRVSGGDDHHMPWHTLAIRTVPSLQEVAISVVAPEYTRKAESPLRSDTPIVVGSQLRFQGSADRMLKSAALRLLPTPSHDPQSATSASTPILLSTADNLAKSINLTMTLESVAAGTYPLFIQLIDRDGLANDRAGQWTVEIHDDAPPRIDWHVKMESPLLLTSRGIIRLSHQAQDDIGLSRIDLLVQLGEPTNSPGRVTLWPDPLINNNDNNQVANPAQIPTALIWDPRLTGFENILQQESLQGSLALVAIDGLDQSAQTDWRSWRVVSDSDFLRHVSDVAYRSMDRLSDSLARLQTDPRLPLSQARPEVDHQHGVFSDLQLRLLDNKLDSSTLGQRVNLTIEYLTLSRQTIDPEHSTPIDGSIDGADPPRPDRQAWIDRLLRLIAIWRQGEALERITQDLISLINAQTTTRDHTEQLMAHASSNSSEEPTTLMRQVIMESENLSQRWEAWLVVFEDLMQEDVAGVSDFSTQLSAARLSIVQANTTRDLITTQTRLRSGDLLDAIDSQNTVLEEWLALLNLLSPSDLATSRVDSQHRRLPVSPTPVTLTQQLARALRIQDALRSQTTQLIDGTITTTDQRRLAVQQAVLSQWLGQLAEHPETPLPDALQEFDTGDSTEATPPASDGALPQPNN